MSAATTELWPVEESPAATAEVPPYSHELAWPDGMAPFKVVDDGTQGDPYAHYAWMRDNAPVPRAASPVSDVWFISRYPVLASCGGTASCATCHVFLEKDVFDTLAWRSEDELELLVDAEGYQECGSRLSCRLHFSSELNGVTVTLAPEE